MNHTSISYELLLLAQMPVIAFHNDECYSGSQDDLARPPSLGYRRETQICVIAKTVGSMRLGPCPADIEDPACY
jgi:hypothetical protein